MNFDREAMQRQMEAKTAITEYEISQSPELQEVRTKLEYAQSALEREQEKLQTTPRLIGQKHNQRYGRQINVVEAAKQEVARVEEEVRKVENDGYRSRYLGRLAAKRNAEQAERDAPMLERAEKLKAEWMANARTRWIAEGGSELLFQMKSEDMYAEHIMQKMKGPDPVEQTKQKFRATGRYDI